MDNQDIFADRIKRKKAPRVKKEGLALSDYVAPQGYYDELDDVYSDKPIEPGNESIGQRINNANYNILDTRMLPTRADEYKFDDIRSKAKKGYDYTTKKRLEAIRDANIMGDIFTTDPVYDYDDVITDTNKARFIDRRASRDDVDKRYLVRKDTLSPYQQASSAYSTNTYGTLGVNTDFLISSILTRDIKIASGPSFAKKLDRTKSEVVQKILDYSTKEVPGIHYIDKRWKNLNWSTVLKKYYDKKLTDDELREMALGSVVSGIIKKLTFFYQYLGRIEVIRAYDDDGVVDELFVLPMIMHDSYDVILKLYEISVALQQLRIDLASPDPNNSSGSILFKSVFQDGMKMYESVSGFESYDVIFSRLEIYVRMLLEQALMVFARLGDYSDFVPSSETGNTVVPSYEAIAEEIDQALDYYNQSDERVRNERKSIRARIKKAKTEAGDNWKIKERYKLKEQEETTPNDRIVMVCSAIMQILNVREGLKYLGESVRTYETLYLKNIGAIINEGDIFRNADLQKGLFYNDVVDKLIKHSKGNINNLKFTSNEGRTFIQHMENIFGTKDLIIPVSMFNKGEGSIGAPTLKELGSCLLIHPTTRVVVLLRSLCSGYPLYTINTLNDVFSKTLDNAIITEVTNTIGFKKSIVSKTIEYKYLSRLPLNSTAYQYCKDLRDDIEAARYSVNDIQVLPLTSEILQRLFADLSLYLDELNRVGGSINEVNKQLLSVFPLIGNHNYEDIDITNSKAMAPIFIDNINGGTGETIKAIFQSTGIAYTAKKNPFGSYQDASFLESFIRSIRTQLEPLLNNNQRVINYFTQLDEEQTLDDFALHMLSNVTIGLYKPEVGGQVLDTEDSLRMYLKTVSSSRLLNVVNNLKGMYQLKRYTKKDIMQYVFYKSIEDSKTSEYFFETIGTDMREYGNIIEPMKRFKNETMKKARAKAKNVLSKDARYKSLDKIKKKMAIEKLALQMAQPMLRNLPAYTNYKGVLPLAQAAGFEELKKGLYGPKGTEVNDIVLDHRQREEITANDKRLNLLNIKKEMIPELLPDLNLSENSDDAVYKELRKRFKKKTSPSGGLNRGRKRKNETGNFP